MIHNLNLPLKKQYLHIALKDELGYTAEPFSFPIIANGDLNGNEKIDILDVMVFLQYTAGATQKNFNVSEADLNGDGRIDNRDATYLLRFIANFQL